MRVSIVELSRLKGFIPTNLAKADAGFPWSECQVETDDKSLYDIKQSTKE